MKTIKGLVITFLAVLLIASGCSGPTKTTQLKWKYKIKSDVRGEIAVNSNALFFHDTHYFYSINRVTGKENWKFDAQSQADQEPNFILTKDSVFLTDGPELTILRRLDIKSGKEIWKFKANIQEKPWVQSGQIKLLKNELYYFFENDIFLINKNTGELIKRSKNNNLTQIDNNFSYYEEWKQIEPDTYAITYYIKDKSGKIIRKLISRGFGENSESPIDIEFFNGKAFYDRDDILDEVHEPAIKALDLRTGKQKWLFQPYFDYLGFNYIKWAKGTLYAGAEYLSDEKGVGILFALDPDTGREKWRIKDENYLIIENFGTRYIIVSRRDSEGSGPENELYETGDKSVSGYDYNGHERWRFIINKKGQHIKAVTQDKDMTYFSIGGSNYTGITGDYYIYALDI